MNGCQDYHVTRRAMMGASAATIMGFSIRDLLAAKGGITLQRLKTSFYSGMAAG